MGVSGGRDQKVHHASPWLAAGIEYGGSEPAITYGHRLIDGQRVEVFLQDAEAAQSLGAHCGRLRHHHPELKFSQSDRTDG